MMKNRDSLFFLLLLIGLSGCNTESTKEEHGDQLQSPLALDLASQYEIDGVRVSAVYSDDDKIKNSFIPRDEQQHTRPIERDYKEAFTLDSVLLKRLNTGDVFELINNTPRYIYQPTIKVNGRLFMIDSLIEPFQIQSFLMPKIEDQIITMSFVDEQPLFKTRMKGYAYVNDTVRALPSKENAFSYEQEMRAHKDIFNDFNFNAHTIDFINKFKPFDDKVGPYPQKKISLQKVELECGFQGTKKLTHDFSSANSKILSLLAHQNDSEHHIYAQTNRNGVATVGHGWLSVRESRLFKPGQTVSTTTYLHEKMHNHGFSHGGGVTGYLGTSAVPDEIIKYVSSGQWSDYYESTLKAKSANTVVVESNVMIFDENTLEIEFTFWTKNSELLEEKINRLFLILPDQMSLQTLHISNGKEWRKISPIDTNQNKRIFQFQNSLDVPIYAYHHEEPEITKIVVHTTIPDGLGETQFDDLIMIASDANRKSIQANHIVHFDTTTGLKSIDDGRFVFTEKIMSMDEEGVFVWDDRDFTPKEAIAKCERHGLKLGPLDKFRSKQQMDFQYKYLQNASQVGIDYSSGLAVAVRVPTGQSGNINAIKYEKTGRLVVCVSENESLHQK